MRRLLAIALLVSACGGPVQPSAPAPSASTDGPTAAPGGSPTAGANASSTSGDVASESGYLAGVDAGTLTARSVARGLSCSESSGGFSGDEPTKQAWSCDGEAADGSSLIMGAQGPDAMHIEMATAEVLTYQSIKVGTITDFLGAMSGLFGGADEVEARTWLLAALPDARRDGSVEADIGANHYRLTFEDNGNSSATYLLVAPSAGPPASPSPGPLPSGPGAAYLGELQGVPGGWTTFVDPDGKFSIAFPGQPTVSGPDATTGRDGSISTSVYQWASNDRETSYAVVVTDHAQGGLNGTEPNVVLDAAAGEYLARFNADQVDRAPTRVGNHFALDVVGTNANGYVCLRFLIVGDRLYVLGGTETHHCPAGMAGFVGSFGAIDQ